MKKQINIRPDTSVYSTYKRLSYQVASALAEFVDNSTQSFFDNKDKLYSKDKYFKGLRVDIRYEEDKLNGDILTIEDNAYGMDEQNFKRAIILDKPPQKNNGRNEFGMGLKTAACWFGNLWSVESKELGSNYKYYAEMDIAAFQKYKGETIDIDEEPESPKEHYTKITIKNLNQSIKGVNTIKKIKKLLGSTYRTDLRTGEIKIYYNDELLTFEFFDPFIDKEGKEWKKNIDFDILFREGTEFEQQLNVNGFIAITIPGSTKSAGFTLLRRGRVVVGGEERNWRPQEIFGASNSFEYQRLYGEINLDEWPVSQAKDSFIWDNDSLEEKLISKLKLESVDYISKARDLRIRENVSTSEIAKTVVKTFKNSSDFTGVEVTIDNTPLDTEEIYEKIKDVEIETYNDSESFKEESVAKIENNKDNFNIEFNYQNIHYIFNVKLISMIGKKWLGLQPIDEINNLYNIEINTKHPFFFPYSRKPDFISLISKLCIGLALAEVKSHLQSTNGKVEPSFIRTKMNEILNCLENSENE
ncbi:MAG: ATP-binding protein [Acholeplasmatales bacterium]|jgi:hypothetical protein|nr:ATP-binding protein [Acholeplasmatales bacterium]